jgi:acyl-CoA synthetase (NDP forming)
VGASERETSVGGRLITNICVHSAFAGDLFLINPNRDSINGKRCYRGIQDVPYAPDVCLVALPASSVLASLEEAGAFGCKFAIVLSSGFGETGEEGKKLEQAMREIVARTGLRIYGPNSPGLSNIHNRLGLNFSPAFKDDLRAGAIGIVTQGGGLGRTFQQAMARGVGVAQWFSPGNEVDLELADFVYHMVESPEIRVIAMMIEGFRDGRKMLAAALHAAHKRKPIVVIKLGKSQYGAKAALSHTTAITGEAEVNSAVFRQLSMLEVNDIDEMVDLAALLSRSTPGASKGLAIYTYSGGTAALTADVIGVSNLELAEFAPRTLDVLKKVLPAFAAIENPVDTTTEVLVNPAIMYESLKAVVTDPGVALTLIPIPIEMGSVTAEMSRAAARLAKETNAAILPVWMTDRLGEGFQILAEAGLVPSRSVQNAVRTAAHWQHYGRMLDSMDHTWVPARLQDDAGVAGSGIKKSWSEAGAKAELTTAGVPVLPSAVCESYDDAVEFAGRYGFPVVLKVSSADILHKSDIGGVKIGIQNAPEMRTAFAEILENVGRARPDAHVDGILVERMAGQGGLELFCGVHRDPVFGHVMTFGAGGLWIELLHDVSRRLLPITASEAASMVREIRYFRVLQGYRSSLPRDLPALEAILMRVSQYVVERADVLEEVEINPIWVGAAGAGAFALDAVLVTRDGGS